MGFGDAGDEGCKLGLAKPEGQGLAQHTAFAGDDKDDAFVVDESMHRFFFTFNPRGYLKRVR